jgi:hypothetical protein
LALLVPVLWTPAGLAQGLPTEQPKVLTIIREHVKVGRAAEHSKYEAGYPAAMEKAKSPDYYIALTSLTGPNEAWYLLPQKSFKSLAESMKRDEKDLLLTAETDRLDAGDVANVNMVETIRATARTDLSVGSFPDLNKVRFYEITIFSVRPGREAQFDEISKAYGTAIKRVASNASFRMYEVIAGMPQPTYIGFSSMEDYGEMDQRMKEDEETFKQATKEEMAAFKNWGEVIAKVESNHFRLDPVQSYVPKSTREKDPEFWMPK